MLRYVLLTIPTSILYVWLFNNTKGSLLLAILFHTAFNTFGNFLLPQLWPELRPQQVGQLTWLYLGVT